MTMASLDPDLLAYLQEGFPGFHLQEKDLVKDDVFFVNTDYKYTRPQHHYYEGFYHALFSRSNEPIRSMNARTGEFYDKPPAPRCMMAFLEAFRRANAAWVEEGIPRESPLRFLVEQGFHFADIAAQIHSGAEIGDDLLGWHFDGPNSLLHLALSLRGSRALRAKLELQSEDAEPGGGSVPAAAAAVDSLPSDAKPKIQLQDYRLPQTAGNLYMGTPFVYMHAVEYPETRKWKDSILALQVRFLFEEKALEDIPRDAFFAVLPSIHAAILKHGVKIPTLADVKEVEATMPESVPFFKATESKGEECVIQ